VIERIHRRLSAMYSYSI